MSDQYIGEIRTFAFNYNPEGWLPCDGRSVSVADYQSLYALIGNTYGGTTTSFNLPDLRGRAAINQGDAPGLSSRRIGQNSGRETVTLVNAQLPLHNHTLSAEKTNATLMCSSALADATTPVGKTISANAKGDNTKRFNSNTPDSAMAEGSVSFSGTTDNDGGNLPHENMPPYLVINYCIATEGLWPPRS